MFKTMKQIIKNKSSVRVRSEFLLPSSWKLSGQSSSREIADWDTSSGVCFSSSSETLQGQWVGPGEKARRKFSNTGGRAPGYRLSQDHFQTVKRMLAPDWAQKMLCIIVTNRQTVSPEFFSWVRTRRLLSRHNWPPDFLVITFDVAWLTKNNVMRLNITLVQFPLVWFIPCKVLKKGEIVRSSQAK